MKAKLTRSLSTILAMYGLLHFSLRSAEASALNTAYKQFLVDNSIPLDSLSSLAETHALNALDQTLVESRVVFLGEPDHYVTEKLEYQFAMIKRLFLKNGFTVIGVEMGRSDAAKINEYIQTGNEDALDAVALFGNLTQVRVPRDLPKGLLAGKKSPEGQQASVMMKQANRKFWKRIRELNVARPTASAPLRVFGFDVDVFVGGGYLDIDSLLRDLRAPAVAKLRDLVTSAKTESRQSEIRNLKKALDFANTHRQELAEAATEDKIGQTLAALKQLIESYEFIDIAFENPNAGQWLDAVARREKTMMWQMNEQLQGTEKIVLIGHNDHLAKNSRVTSLQDSSAPFVPTWYKIGTYIKEKLGKQVYSIWMLYGGGARSWGPQCPTAQCSIHIRHNTVNADLAELSSKKPFLFAFPQAVTIPDDLRKTRDYQFNGGIINSTKIIEQADAILFVPVVRPIQPF